LTYEKYLVGMGLLTANYPPRGYEVQSFDALYKAWWSVIHGTDEEDSRGVITVIGGKPWITEAVFVRGVRECLSTVKGWLPTVSEFVGLCNYAKSLIEDEVSASRSLPPPARREVGEIDPSDPYSCTPAERERWAREDVWLRGFATLHHPLPSSVASWVQLRPIERRAKEQRIERERLAAYAQIRQHFHLPEPEIGGAPFGIPGTPRPAPVQWDTSRLDQLLAEHASSWPGAPA